MIPKSRLILYAQHHRHSSGSLVDTKTIQIKGPPLKVRPIMSRPTHSGNAVFGIAVLGITLLLGACQPAVDTPTASDNSPRQNDPIRKLTVYTVNYPLAYFARRIGGQNIEVVFPAPADEDPADWFPSPEIIARFQQADLILLNGPGYAAWTGQASLPSARMLDTSRSFADQYINLDDTVPHSHGPEGQHSHRDIAFTTWLDPRLARQQALAIRDALTKRRPDLQDDYEAGYDALAEELDQLDRDLQAAFERLDKRPVLFSHPVYQYLIGRYGLNARSTHLEPDTGLTEADITDLATLLAAHPATLMIWESDPLAASETTLESRGLSSIVFSPAANTPADGDYLDVMRRNLASLKEAS
jgi:zinc transport system substrate-binding protein